MKVERYLSALRSARAGVITKKASPGEAVFGALFPNRGTGWPPAAGAKIGWSRSMGLARWQQ
jgi:hypothetical protein